MIGTKLFKGQYAGKDYAEVAHWCNTNNATIQDMGGYYEVVEFPEPTLEEAREEKWEEIKAARDKAEQSGCPYMDSVLDSDSLSVQRINTAVQAAQVIGEAFEVDWTMQDNTVIHMTYADVLGMPAALAVFSNELHMKARKLREQINAANRVEEVNAISWQQQRTKG